jgi:biopolymer transport protein TolR
MASLSTGDDDDLLASINIIPFVDIILVVLTIFMLTSAVIVKASLEVKLPKAASGGSTVGKTLNLVLDAQGGLEIDGRPRTVAEAGRLVRAAVAADPKVQAVISADRTVDYGLVIELIDTVKLNGLTTFALDVERVAPAGAGTQ